MPNQHTIRAAGSKARKGKLVTLSVDEKTTLQAGATALRETPAETLRRGGLERALRALRGASVALLVASVAGGCSQEDGPEMQVPYAQPAATATPPVSPQASTQAPVTDTGDMTPTPEPAADDTGDMTPVPHRGLWIEPGMPVEATIKACQVWAEFGLSCDLAPDETAYLHIRNSGDTDCTQDSVDPPHVWLGSTSLGSGNSVIRLICFRGAVETNPDIARYYTMVTAHEIGHGMGLNHVADTTAIMNALADPLYGSITDADRIEFHNVWGDLSPPP